MKKFNLFLLAVCCGMSAMAADFEWGTAPNWGAGWQAPSECSGTNYAYGWWYGNAAVPDPMPTHKNVTIKKAQENFDPAEDFDTQWALLGTANAITNVVTNTNNVSTDGVTISWNGCYDDENIYIYILAEKDRTAENDGIEICVAPYFALANTPGATDAYVRYAQFGAWKVGFTTVGGTTGDVCTGNIATQGTGGTQDLVVLPSATCAVEGDVAKWIVTIPHLAVSGDCYAGYCNGEGLLDDNSAWKALSDNQGLNFEVKYTDKDPSKNTTGGDGATVEAKAEYWWNSTDNNAYQSTAFCGFLAPSDDVIIIDGINDGEIAVSNMTIAANQITLAEPADVKIMNAAGMLIKSINDATVVSTIDLPAGTYIVVAGNESATFVK
ncbi:MAG: T9SS type A sorting domain-containing protein [Bacteroidales bacterium]|nr:T9SS type A sorting domain-containing protein [Bacteroidales bacterium]